MFIILLFSCFFFLTLVCQPRLCGNQVCMYVLLFMCVDVHTYQFQPNHRTPFKRPQLSLILTYPSSHPLHVDVINRWLHIEMFQMFERFDGETENNKKIGFSLKNWVIIVDELLADGELQYLTMVMFWRT